MEAQELKNLIFASIISAENDSLTEEVKQEIISRFNEERGKNKEWKEYNWEYILEPLEDEEKVKSIAEKIR